MVIVFAANARRNCNWQTLSFKENIYSMHTLIITAAPVAAKAVMRRNWPFN